MLKAEYSTVFKKDIKRIKKRKLDLTILEKVIDDLINQIALDPKYKDHSLIGNYVNHRECHLKPDWLLIYYYYKDDTIVFYRTGTHSDLFD